MPWQNLVLECSVFSSLFITPTGFIIIWSVIHLWPDVFLLIIIKTIFIITQFGR
jgi:hypothetical protein